MKPEDYANTTPRLDLFTYFKGNTQAWGMFQDRFGEVRRRFTVQIDGEIEGEELTLDEAFEYADGETQRRVWTIKRLDEHHYQGRADDVVGVAQGKSYGNALNWRYDLLLEVDGKQWQVHFNDWMFLQDDKVLINRAKVSKYGFTIGEVTLFFLKP
jgi:hypothetical protein